MKTYLKKERKILLKSINEMLVETSILDMDWQSRSLDKESWTFGIIRFENARSRFGLTALRMAGKTGAVIEEEERKVFSYFQHFPNCEFLKKLHILNGDNWEVLENEYKTFRGRVEKGAKIYASYCRFLNAHRSLSKSHNRKR
jgi:hypothetical protein